MPESVLHDSFAEMARDGADGNEGVVLWLGRRKKGNAEITHLVTLRGPGVIKEPDLLTIENNLMNEVTDVAVSLGVCLVGQIHSHGPWAGTDLSFSDRNFGIAVPFFLSIVAVLRKNLIGITLRLFPVGIHDVVRPRSIPS